VNQQIAHCYVRVAQVSAEKHFAKVLNKLVARRVTTEKLAALMPRAVKCAVTLVDVVDQRTEERWAQLGFIMAGCIIIIMQPEK
jgi:hypothetical protein